MSSTNKIGDKIGALFFPFNTPRLSVGGDIEGKNNVLRVVPIDANVRCPVIDGSEHPGDELVPYDVDGTHLILSLFRSPFIITLHFRVVLYGSGSAHVQDSLEFLVGKMGYFGASPYAGS